MISSFQLHHGFAPLFISLLLFEEPERGARLKALTRVRSGAILLPHIEKSPHWLAYDANSEASVPRWPLFVNLKKCVNCSKQEPPKKILLAPTLGPSACAAGQRKGPRDKLGPRQLGKVVARLR